MQTHRIHEVGHVEEHHHEHKPVIKKVKEKVKKIKEKITKHGHDHEEEHEQSHDYSTEEDYDDDEVHVDPAVHGAHPHLAVHEIAGLKNPVDPAVHGAHTHLAVHESDGLKNPVGERAENLGGQGKVSLGEVMAKTSVDQDPSMPKWDQSGLIYPSVAEEQMGKHSHDIVNLGKIEGRVEEDPAAPKIRTGTAASAPNDQLQPTYRSTVGGTDNTSPKVNLEGITGRVEEDPVWGATTERYTPTYPSPIGAKDDVGESPMLTSFKAMAISDEPKSAESIPATATSAHSQISTETPRHDEAAQGSEQQQKTASSYTDTLSSTATAVKDAAISAAVGSTEYGKKIAHTVYETVSGAGSKGGAEGDQGVRVDDLGEADKGVSMKEYIVGKLRPGEEDRALSEVLSDTVHIKKQEVVGTGSGDGGAGKGVVDKIKGAVGSWIGAGAVPPDADGARVAEGTGTDISGGVRDERKDASRQEVKL